MIERTDVMPKEGEIEAFDAGWYSHEIGISRETVEVLASATVHKQRWALLGWDCRAEVVEMNSNDEPTL